MTIGKIGHYLIARITAVDAVAELGDADVQGPVDVVVLEAAPEAEPRLLTRRRCDSVDQAQRLLLWLCRDPSALDPDPAPPPSRQ